MIDEEVCPWFTVCEQCFTWGKILLSNPSRLGGTSLRALLWPLAGAHRISGHQAKGVRTSVHWRLPSQEPNHTLILHLLSPSGGALRGRFFREWTSYPWQDSPHSTIRRVPIHPMTPRRATMSCQSRVDEWTTVIRTELSPLSQPQATGLALWSLGMGFARSGAL